MANGPWVLLADEPTGELDTAMSDEIFDVLRDLSAADGVTVVVVTHDPGVSERVERTVAIRDGRTSSEVLRRSAGEHVIAEEYAVMDRAGRVQVPRGYREALGLTRRVRLTLEENRVELWPEAPLAKDAAPRPRHRHRSLLCRGSTRHLAQVQRPFILSRGWQNCFNTRGSSWAQWSWVRHAVRLAGGSWPWCLVSAAAAAVVVAVPWVRALARRNPASALRGGDDA